MEVCISSYATFEVNLINYDFFINIFKNIIERVLS